MPLSQSGVCSSGGAARLSAADLGDQETGLLGRAFRRDTGDGVAQAREPVGFVLRELKFPMAPMILGLVLGELLESNLTRALVLSDGSLVPFFTRPVSGILAAITIVSIVWSVPAAQTRIRAGFRAAFRRNASG